MENKSQEVVMVPCKKPPMSYDQCEEMFSENPKETPPLFYQFDALREPVEMNYYSDYNTSLNYKKEAACQEGDEYAYHPFYMMNPFDKTTPDILYANREAADVEADVPAPKCPTKVDVVGLVVDGQKNE